MITTQAGVELQSFEYWPRSATYYAAFDQETTTTSMAVIGTMTTILDCDPTELDPLYDAIDVDALNDCLQVRDATSDPVSVSFSFETYGIMASSAGTVAATPLPAIDYLTVST